MTKSQWIYYFVTELSGAVRFLSDADALGIARAAKPIGEPEEAARALAAALVAPMLLPAGAAGLGTPWHTA